MITTKHLKIYREFNGDGDMLIRMGSIEQKEALNYENWKLIEEFLEDILLIKRGLASKEFKENLYSKLKQNCDSKETIAQLEELANK